MYSKEQLIAKGLHNRNAITNRFYLGLGNQMALKNAGFKKPEWLTFRQAKNSWLKIKRWAKSVIVYYQDELLIKEEKDKKIEKKLVPYKRYHRVFNIDQTESTFNP